MTAPRIVQSEQSQVVNSVRGEVIWNWTVPQWHLALWVVMVVFLELRKSTKWLDSIKPKDEHGI